MVTNSSVLARPAAEHSHGFWVERYSPARQREWDAFVRASSNATFLFCRDYMDYHCDRFIDHSIMVFHNRRLAAVLPANLRKDGMLVSHEGLTYGGLGVSEKATLGEVLTCFHAILRFLNEQGIFKLLYKRIPGFYTTRPDDDIGYCLFLAEAELSQRNCALVVSMANRVPLQKRRKRQINRAARSHLQIVQESKFSAF